MRPLTAEKRNRKSKKLFFFPTLSSPESLHYKCKIYSPSFPLPAPLFIPLLSAVLHLLIQRAKNVLCSL